MAGKIKVTTAMSDHLLSPISPNNRVLVSCLHINLCKCNVSTFFQLLTWDSYLRYAQVLKWISQRCEQPTIAWYFASKTIIVSLNLQDEKVVVFFLPKDLMCTPIILFVYSSEWNARKQISDIFNKYVFVLNRATGSRFSHHLWCLIVPVLVSVTSSAATIIALSQMYKT